jgi:hypothetical protein
MRKRILKRLGLLIVVASVGFILLLWLTAPANITTNEKIDEVRYEMTEDEVVGVLGTNGSSELSNPTLCQALGNHEGKKLVCREWKTRDGAGLVVAFDENGKNTRMVRWKGIEETWLDKIRRWLRLAS